MIRQRLHVRLGRPLLALALVLIAATASAQQDLNQLKAAAEDFLQKHYSQPKDSSSSHEISVAGLDPRLRLSQCSVPLSFNLRDMNDNGGAVSVKVACEDEQPWSIYISAQVSIYRDVLVANAPLGRGTLIEQASITQQRLNTSSMRQGYFTSPEQVLGLQLRRPLAAGEPLRSGVLEQPLAVVRGDIVTLESTTGAIQVATQAEALSSGRVGEQIRVRNTSSQKVVNANILGEGRVGANF